MFLPISSFSSILTQEYPWTYDVDLFGGPDFWGLVNREWRMCKNGQAQSPINIDPNRLLFDPHLTHIRIEGADLDAIMENVGQMPLITLNDSSSPAINISGGPAVPYKYQLSQIIVHFGKSDGGEKGSEHTVDRVRYPAEVQLLAFNRDLYDNLTFASSQPRGLLALSVLVDIGHSTEPELRRITLASQNIIYKGKSTTIKSLRPTSLIPRTHHFVTYDGSLTFPGCDETVTWIIFNKPIYMTKEHLERWNELQQSEEKNDTPQPMTPLYRPLKPLNGRLLRTNINFSFKAVGDASCPANIYTELGYRASATKKNETRRGKRDVDEPVASLDSSIPFTIDSF